MSTVGDLVRNLKANPHRVDPVAAGKVLAQAGANGTATAAEVAELADLLGTLDDGFAPELRENLTRFLQGAGRQPTLPVKDLLPDLGKLATPKDVADRVGADFLLLKDQLLPGDKSAKDKAERLAQFLGAYADRFVGLASGEKQPPKQKAASEVLDFQAVKAKQAQDAAALKAADRPRPLPAAEHKELARRFGQALEEQGFRQLRDARSGRDGVALGVHLASAANLAELNRRLAAARLELPAGAALAQSAPPAHQTMSQLRAVAMPRDLGESGGLKDRARPDLDRVGAAKLEAMRVSPWQADAGRIVVAPVQPQAKDARAEDAAAARAGRQDKVLGRNMLWNWLHTFREGATDEAEQRAQLQQLAVAGVLVILALAMVAAAIAAW